MAVFPPCRLTPTLGTFVGLLAAFGFAAGAGLVLFLGLSFLVEGFGGSLAAALVVVWVTAEILPVLADFACAALLTSFFLEADLPSLFGNAGTDFWAV